MEPQPKRTASTGNFEDDTPTQKTNTVTPTLTIDLSTQATQNHPTTGPQKTSSPTPSSQAKTASQAPQKPDAALIEKLARKSLSDLEREEEKARQKLAALKLARQKKATALEAKQAQATRKERIQILIYDALASAYAFRRNGESTDKQRQMWHNIANKWANASLATAKTEVTRKKIEHDRTLALRFFDTVIAKPDDQTAAGGTQTPSAPSPGRSSQPASGSAQKPGA